MARYNSTTYIDQDNFWEAVEAVQSAATILNEDQAKRVVNAVMDTLDISIEGEDV